jgi:hypothetical protein
MAYWETVGRPGYFGRHREEKYQEFDKAYGKGRWRIVWLVDGEHIGFDQVVLWYEEAYVEYLRRRDDLLRVLTQEACNVYDDAPSNIFSGINYHRQETARTHLQDIAIRRAVVRLGTWFRGEQLIQIRGPYAASPVHPLSEELYPARVPFHRPELILQPVLTGWWTEHGPAGNTSVEAFYQSNKQLQVRL